MQELCDEMIEISHLGNISYDEYPKFKFNSVNQIDLSQTAVNLTSLYEKQIVSKREGDEQYIRELFGLPEIAEVEVVNDVDDEVSADKLLSKSFQINKRHDNVFDVEKANNTFLESQEKIDIIIKKYYDQLLAEFATQAEADIEKAKNNLRIPMILKEKFVEELEEEYNEIYKTGSSDVVAELLLLGVVSAVIGKDSPINKTKIKMVDKMASKLLNNTKTVVEKTISKTNETIIKNAGGVKEYFTRFDDYLKNDKRDIRVEVQEGYQDGRGEVMKENKEKIIKYQYDATLDQNLCEECAPHDGKVYTIDEINELGFNIGGAVNPECHGLRGGNQCRCQLLPFEVVE
jgi:hypothetical protein